MKSNDERVTVIIPIFNGERFLEKTIESVCIQTYCGLEIILVDDCSCDRSLELANRMSKFDSRIRVISNVSNLGLMRNCNKGASYASGDYLMFLGQDDFISPDHIEKMLQVFSLKTSFVSCAAKIVDSSDAVVGVFDNGFNACSATQEPMTSFIKGNFVASTGLVMRRECFLKVGGYPHYDRNYGEWLLWIKMASVGEVGFSKDVHSYYRRHDHNITNEFNSVSKKLKLSLYFVKCRFSAFLSGCFSFYSLFYLVVFCIRDCLSVFKLMFVSFLKYFK